MKIFSAEQIRACDTYTIHAGNIRSIDLMERAASKCVDWLVDYMPKDTPFVVVCGSGNNGGDGLAIARMLNDQGYGVKCFLLKLGETYSNDCNINLQRLKTIDVGLVDVLEPDTFITDIPKHVVIIDALLGTGLNRPAQGWVGDFIKHINSLPNRKVAIDIPSGLPADSVPDKNAPIIKVDNTLSFQFYKRSFLHPETGVYAGNVHVLDIGLSGTYINATHSQYNTIDEKLINSIYRPRSPFSHKGTYGHALMIGGSYGKMGAITLSSKAALRTGAGLVTALIPGCGYDILQTALPEVMCRTSGEDQIDSINGWEWMNAIGIGPGIGTNEATAKSFATFIDKCMKPVVIDADGLNMLADRKELLGKITPDSILTPHPKEFARLFGDSPNSMLQLEHARTQAMRYNIYIVLKDHHTVVVTPEGACWYNLTGNAGMATGGAGDVLTGIITGLLAQGYSSLHAAMLGVYLHGLAGDYATVQISQEALIAGDIIEHLNRAFLQVKQQHYAVAR